MKSVYIIGPPGSGKTMVAVGIALKARDSGKRVSYFKPITGSREFGEMTDEDTALMMSILGLPYAPKDMTLFSAGPVYLSRYRSPSSCQKRLRSGFELVSREADLVIIEGPPVLESFRTLGIDAVSAAGLLGSGVIVVSAVQDDRSVDEAVMYHDLARSEGVKVGLILNHVAPTMLARCREVYRVHLERRGCNVLGVIPRRSEAALPTVREFAEAVGGKVLTGEEKLDRRVQDILVGAMSYDVAIDYFRKAPNKVVITGGDRSEIALAALETSTSAIILTGGLHPPTGVLVRAEEKGVPVILVQEDTYGTVEMLHRAWRKLKPEDELGIGVAKENVDRYCDWNRLSEFV